MHPSRLPVELWGEIGKRVSCREDVVRFRSVCKAWRSSLASPSRFPMRVPAPPGAFPELESEKAAASSSAAWWCMITEIEIYKYKHGKGTLVPLEAKPQGGKFRRIRGVPARLVEDLSCLSFVVKAYGIRLLDPSRSVLPKWPCGRQILLDRAVVVISSDANGGVDANYCSPCDVSLVARLPSGRLALLRLNDDPHDQYWDTTFCTHRFLRIETYKGRLRAVDYQGRVFLTDYHSCHMTQIDIATPRDPSQYAVQQIMCSTPFQY